MGCGLGFFVTSDGNDVIAGFVVVGAAEDGALGLWVEGDRDGLTEKSTAEGASVDEILGSFVVGFSAFLIVGVAVVGVNVNCGAEFDFVGANVGGNGPRE